MKKILLSLLCFFCIGIYANAANEAITGWGTKDANYKARENTDGWKATNSALVEVDGVVCPTLNGKTSGKGVLTSPELTGGISSLTLKAKNTFSESKGISLKAEIKQDDAVVASHDFITNNDEISETWSEISVEGNYVIVITNNCPSNNSSKNKDRASITSLTWEELASPDAPEPVNISCDINGGVGTVTMSCPTDGATIYYGFSGDEINVEYTAPFTVTETCTIYARAHKGEEKSNMSEYYIDLPYTSFKKVIDNSALTDYVTIIGDFQVIYQNKDKGRLILTDGTSNLLIYKSGNDYSIDYPVGTKISKINGTVVNFHNCFRLIEAELTEGGNGAEYAPVEVTSLQDLSYDENIFDEILIKNCNISGKELGTPVIELGGETAVLYDLFEVGYENVTGCEITAFVWRYDDILRIVPISIEGGEITATVETPVITPNKRELNLNETVTITCKTEGATIYYTLDGTEPSQDSEKYTAPIPFTEDCTIKARAYYEGDDKTMFPSAVAERTYHVMDPTCNVITEGNHDVDEKNSLNSYQKHTCTVDGVEYHMNAAHLGEAGNGTTGTESSLMMNNKGRFCYLIQVGENEGYVVDKIELAYNTESKTEFAVRGANTPFDDSAESSADYEKAIKGHGVLIGSMSKDNQSIEFEKDYKYFALYPTNSGAVYLDNITIRYREIAPIADAPELTDDLADEFESDEESLLIPALPSHEDWTPMYQVNDGDTYEADTEGTCHDEALEPASLHVIKIWYEHYNGVDKSEPKEYFHVTAPQVTVENPQEDATEKVTTIDFGTIGEGVVVYFTLNGTDPTVAETANKVRARVSTEDGVYNIESREDLDMVHAVSATSSIVKIHPISGESLPEISLVTKAVHSESGTASHVTRHDTQIDITTGVADIEVSDASEAVYFNLQGVRVVNPENGTYIRVTKGKAEKVVK